MLTFVQMKPMEAELFQKCEICQKVITYDECSITIRGIHLCQSCANNAIDYYKNELIKNKTK